MEEKKKKVFSTKNKLVIGVAIVLFILLMTNVYAVNNGYGNIFFMIKNIFVEKEVTGQENLLSDREIVISYSSIEIAEGLKIQIQKIVLEENQSELYVYVQNENTESTLLRYKVYDESNNLIAEYKSIGPNQNEGPNYIDRIKIAQKVNENAKLKLEIYGSEEKLLSTITIDLANKEILVAEEEIIDKQSEVELKKYLGVFAILNRESGEHTKKNDNIVWAATQLIHISLKQIDFAKIDGNKNANIELVNNIVDEFYGEEVEKVNGIIKTEYYHEKYGYDAFLYPEVSYGECLEITDISYKNKIYTVKFVYVLEGEGDENIEDLPQYEATAELKINENPEYSKYKLLSLTEGKLVKDAVIKEEKNNIYDEKAEEDIVKELLQIDGTTIFGGREYIINSVTVVSDQEGLKITNTKMEDYQTDNPIFARFNYSVKLLETDTEIGIKDGEWNKDCNGWIVVDIEGGAPYIAKVDTGISEKYIGMSIDDIYKIVHEIYGDFPIFYCMENDLKLIKYGCFDINNDGIFELILFSEKDKGERKISIYTKTEMDIIKLGEIDWSTNQLVVHNNKLIRFPGDTSENSCYELSIKDYKINEKAISKFSWGSDSLLKTDSWGNPYYSGTVTTYLETGGTPRDKVIIYKDDKNYGDFNIAITSEQKLIVCKKDKDMKIIAELDYYINKDYVKDGSWKTRSQGIGYYVDWNNSNKKCLRVRIDKYSEEGSSRESYIWYTFDEEGHLVSKEEYKG